MYVTFWNIRQKSMKVDEITSDLYSVFFVMVTGCKDHPDSAPRFGTQIRHPDSGSGPPKKVVGARKKSFGPEKKSFGPQKKVVRACKKNRSGLKKNSGEHKKNWVGTKKIWWARKKFGRARKLNIYICIYGYVQECGAKGTYRCNLCS